MNRNRAVAVIAAIAAVAAFDAVPLPAAGETGAREVPVRFAKGARAADLRGAIQGAGDVDYTLGARAGQTLSVTLDSAHPSLGFNIYAPGAQGAMFIGSLQGVRASVMLPADGNYLVRVYLMRSASRRNEHAAYALKVAVDGAALEPLPGARDALLPGTRFHAAAELPCQLYGMPPGGSCKAFVTRRGRDATATVEVHGAAGAVRRVLFVDGKPVASDTNQPLASSRHGDAVTVRIGDDERIDVPDAFLSGG